MKLMQIMTSAMLVAVGLAVGSFYTNWLNDSSAEEKEEQLALETALAAEEEVVLEPETETQEEETPQVVEPAAVVEEAPAVEQKAKPQPTQQLSPEEIARRRAEYDRQFMQDAARSNPNVQGRWKNTRTGEIRYGTRPFGSGWEYLGQ